MQLLYSQYSQACIINPNYADPATFDQVMDIFVTESLSSTEYVALLALLIPNFRVADTHAHPILSSLIDSAFGEINSTIYGSFNARLLNETIAEINDTIVNGGAVSPGYLFATLTAYNASGTDDGDGSASGGATAESSGGGGPNNGPNTSLAMCVPMLDFMKCSVRLTVRFCSQDYIVCNHRLRICIVLRGHHLRSMSHSFSSLSSLYFAYFTSCISSGHPRHPPPRTLRSPCRRDTIWRPTRSAWPSPKSRTRACTGGP